MKTRDRDLEHPDITAALRTGYPVNRNRTPTVFCYVCDCEFYVEEACPDAICESCQEVLSRYERDEPA